MPRKPIKPLQRLATAAALGIVFYFALNAGIAHAEHACLMVWQIQGQPPKQACTQTAQTVSDAGYSASCLAGNVTSAAMTVKATVLKACPSAQAACAETNGSSTAYYYGQTPQELNDLKGLCLNGHAQWLDHPN